MHSPARHAGGGACRRGCLGLADGGSCCRGGAGDCSRTGLGQHHRQAVREARGRGVPLPHPARCPHHLQLHGMGPPSACRPAAPPFLLFHSPAPHPATGTPDKVRYPSTPTTEDEAAAPRRSFWWPALCTVFAGSRAGPPPGDNWGLGPAYTQPVLEVTETFSPTGEQPPHGGPPGDAAGTRLGPCGRDGLCLRGRRTRGGQAPSMSQRHGPGASWGSPGGGQPLAPEQAALASKGATTSVPSPLPPSLWASMRDP